MVPVWPLSLCVLASASLSAFNMAGLCSIRADACSLSGPLLPRFVQDPFLCTFMCCPMPLFPCSPSPPLLTASKPCPLPSVPQLSHCRTQCICPQCFSFQFSSQSWAISPQLCPLGLWQWAADSRCSVCTVGGCAVSAVGCLTGCTHLVMATVLICR